MKLWTTIPSPRVQLGQSLVRYESKLGEWGEDYKAKPKKKCVSFLHLF